MRKRITILLLITAFVLSLSACDKKQSDPPFEVTFIDVGQGDAALVKCDGEYMLVDVGVNTKASSEAIRELLLDKGVYELKYLVISHWHEDHYGGLRQKPNALQNITAIDTLLCNQDPYTKSNLGDVMSVISEITDEIIVPDVGNKSYKLGSASIDVIDVCADQGNDSLVLLINYGKTRFLFTGDIVEKAHSRVASTLREMSGTLKTGENLIKMPHHGGFNVDLSLPSGASDNSLATLVDASYAKHFVISVGEGNSYGHPHRETLDIISQALETDVQGLDRSPYFFRTDKSGNITFTSNGKTITPVN